MFSNWISFLAYPNLFGIKGFVVSGGGDGVVTRSDSQETKIKPITYDSIEP
jgi:hypothetical protein